MTVTYRSVKGSDLTPAEADANTLQFDTKTKDGWKDLICGIETRSGPQAPTLKSAIGGIYLFAFAPDAMNEVFATAHVGHDYKVDTMVYPHIHWTTNTTSTGTVRWGYEYTWARRHDSTGQTHFPTTDTLYVEQYVDGTPFGQYVAELGVGNAIPGTGIEPDVIVLLRVFRDATHVNDTFPDDAFGFTVDLHYQADRAATINKDPNFYA